MLHRLYVSARRLRKRAGALEFRGYAQHAVVVMLTGPALAQLGITVDGA
jgi:hypothetical protein